MKAMIKLLNKRLSIMVGADIKFEYRSKVSKQAIMTSIINKNINDNIKTCVSMINEANDIVIPTVNNTHN
jgi:copper homeostasis protein CutC